MKDLSINELKKVCEILVGYANDERVDYVINNPATEVTPDTSFLEPHKLIAQFEYLLKAIK